MIIPTKAPITAFTIYPQHSPLANISQAAVLYNNQMRIWDVEPSLLCRKHLLGEHRELHGLWNVLTQNKKGYSRHPETRRWEGKLKALYNRHEALVKDMALRNYNHKTPLDPQLATGEAVQEIFIHSIPQQYQLLKEKGCTCL